MIEKILNHKALKPLSTFDLIWALPDCLLVHEKELPTELISTRSQNLTILNKEFSFPSEDTSLYINRLKDRYIAQWDDPAYGEICNINTP